MKRSKHYLARKLLGMAVLGIMALLLSSCGASTSSPNTVSTAVARSVAATVAAQPKPATLAPAIATAQSPTVPSPTNPPAPAGTRLPTGTPAPTNTPAPSRTPGPTDTPAPTVTPRPTVTPTHAPGIGDVIQCGKDWNVKVIQQPSLAKTLNVLDTGGYLTFSNTDPAKGIWMVVLFELTNLQNKTDDLYSFDDPLLVKGWLNKSWLSFSPSSWGTSSLQRSEGISNWRDDVPPGITSKMLAIFDVNPAASDWKLAIKTARCETEVALSDMSQPAASEGPVVAVGASSVNLRSGPGTGYAVAGQANANQRYPIMARTADKGWWQICCVGGKNAWVAASVVSILGDASSIPIAQDIPTPPLAPPTAVPVALPKTVPLGQEFPTTLWGLKLYDVKRAKAVYWFGSAEIANGTWLIPFVEFRNLGSGTNQPSSNLHFYLQDAAGRTFDYDVFNDAELGAAWQFKAGHLYDKINPSSVLGVAIPFDVAPSLGDMWLRVKEAPGVVMYLGNVSQMQETK